MVHAYGYTSIRFFLCPKRPQSLWLDNLFAQPSIKPIRPTFRAKYRCISAPTTITWRRLIWFPPFPRPYIVDAPRPCITICTLVWIPHISRIPRVTIAQSEWLFLGEFGTPWKRELSWCGRNVCTKQSAAYVPRKCRWIRDTAAEIKTK